MSLASGTGTVSCSSVRKAAVAIETGCWQLLSRSVWLSSTGRFSSKLNRWDFDPFFDQLAKTDSSARGGSL
ncbi:MAG: hypothetical protein R3C11_10635 [Planctomycetaceae bacterium]